MWDRTNPYKLTNTQINMLHHLVRRGGWDTVISIRRYYNDSNRHLGPRYPELIDEYDQRYSHPSLLSLGYVGVRYEQDEERTGGKSIVYYLTPEGEDAATRFRGRKRDEDYKIPDEQLVPAATVIRPTRAYSFESYTREDLDQIRDLLDDYYQEVSDESLKHQLANLRKKGAFADRDLDGKWPDWYRHYRTLVTWQDTADTAIVAASERCSVNWQHDGEGPEGKVDVYHRAFSRHGDCVLGREEPRDLIVLCQACRKKLRTSLARPPEDRPTW